MRRFFCFWWRCAKYAFRGNTAFANDWQWVFGIPAISGISIWANARFGDPALMSTGIPIADGFLGALGAFLVTWTIAFVARFLNAPAILYYREKERADSYGSHATEANEWRKHLKAKLEYFYVQVGPIITRNLPPDISEADFKKYECEANNWVDEASGWINQNLGTPAQARFLDRSGMLAMSVTGAVNEAHNAIMQNLTRFRKNLTVLIENEQWWHVNR